MIWEELAANVARELEEHPQDFLRQKTISKTTHPNMRPLSLNYWKELVRKDYFLKEIFFYAWDGSFGEPYEFEFFPRISPQSIQHAYYINMMYERMGIWLEDVKSIVEIGGGYGNFARIARNMGFRDSYKIVDLPEIHVLQKHYLDNTSPGHGVEFISVDRIEPAELLMATFSVSEMPMELREKLETHYPKFQYLFFGSTDSFDGTDNVRYFKELAKRIGGECFKDAHRNAWFLLCKR